MTAFTVEPARETPCAHPPLERASMAARPWAGPLLARPLRRLRGHRSARVPRRAGDRRPLRLRRVALLALVLTGAWVGAHAMADVLPTHGDGWAEGALLVLFAILFGWISAGFWTGIMGACVLVRGQPGPLLRGAVDATLMPLDPAARTAIVMPICNEHVPTVFGGLAATIASLRSTGEAANFDVFVLSDTNDADIRAAEQAAWTDLAAAQATPGVRVHYRWRQQRSKRKSGNVADFCRRWGAGYRYFVVLDADSVMTGECLTSLVRMMESHPQAGIIQTAPRPFGHETFHARVQQFCGRAYGPLFTAGMRFWQLGESHYWGHNAILRTGPFMQHCGLAAIEGAGSLSGEILSHDFVEAALMRRAGWQVWVADDLDGSYEQVPPNLLAELQRDRRWCQGNLQNARLAAEPGLHTVHRVAFLTGALSYATSPLWLLFLVLSSFLFAQQAGNEPIYFIESYQLFPTWPSANLKLMLTLFGLTAVLLFAPKVLSIGAIVVRGQANRFGGTPRLIVSALIEFVHSMLLAPVRMLFHTEFVLAALFGWKLEWKSPPRDDASTGWNEAIGRHGLHTGAAVAWTAALVLGSSAFPWWLSPILLGLLLAIPLSVWGSRVDVGRAFRRRGLMLTPEETRTPSVLLDAAREADGIATRLVSFATAVTDAAMQQRVVGALPPHGGGTGAIASASAVDAAKGRALADRIEQALVEGPGALTRDDRLRLLSSASALATLHEEVAARRAHPAWWYHGDEGEGAPRQRAAKPGVPAEPAFG